MCFFLMFLCVLCLKCESIIIICTVKLKVSNSWLLVKVKYKIEFAKNVPGLKGEWELKSQYTKRINWNSNSWSLILLFRAYVLIECYNFYLLLIS